MKIEEKSDDKAVRQRDLARWIGKNVVRCDKIKPLGAHGSFFIPGRGEAMRQYALTDRVCDAMWLPVGSMLAECSKHRIMDHAWAFGFDDKTAEPWGFVTEPYMELQHAALAMKNAHDMFAHDWNIQIWPLGYEQSSWNPHRCLPFVVFLSPESDIQRLALQSMNWIFDTYMDHRERAASMANVLREW